MVVKIYKIILFLHNLNVPILPTILNYLLIRVFFSCKIGLGAKIGKNVILGYDGLGVVIHSRAVIGDNVLVAHGVTIGGTTKKYEVPVIGNNTLLLAGSKIIGPIRIGDNCVIGANAVVISDLPNNCLAVGAPAKIVKSNINIYDYR